MTHCPEIDAQFGIGNPVLIYTRRRKFGRPPCAGRHLVFKGWQCLLNVCRFYVCM